MYFFFFLPDFSTWIFGHRFKLQIAKIKWTNSHHTCKTTPTCFSSSWFRCLSRGHYHPVAQVKTWSHSYCFFYNIQSATKLCEFYFLYFTSSYASLHSTTNTLIQGHHLLSPVALQETATVNYFSGLSFLPVPNSNYTLCCFQKKLSQMQEGK